jgi:hypothetical protein
MMKRLTARGKDATPSAISTSLAFSGWRGDRSVDVPSVFQRKKARKRALPARADLPSFFFCFGKQLEADLYVGPSLHAVVLCRRHCCLRC